MLLSVSARQTSPIDGSDWQRVFFGSSSSADSSSSLGESPPGRRSVSRCADDMAAIRVRLLRVPCVCTPALAGCGAPRLPLPLPRQESELRTFSASCRPIRPTDEGRSARRRGERHERPHVPWRTKGRESASAVSGFNIHACMRQSAKRSIDFVQSRSTWLPLVPRERSSCRESTRPIHRASPDEHQPRLGRFKE